MSAVEPQSGQKPALAGGLPLPSEEARAHSIRMLEYLKSLIQDAGGRISFQAYMSAALFAPQLGYYRCGTEKFGAAGDFITAAEISPLFAQCLANFKTQLACANNILEVGAGSGKLAAGILQHLQQQDALPENYFILELSDELRQRQQQTLCAVVPDYVEKVVFLNDIPSGYDGLVLANELLDAMPVRRFRLKENNLYEQYVIWRDGVLCYEDVPSQDVRLQARVDDIKKQCEIENSRNYLSEINFVAEDWVKTLGQKINKAVMLLIDYGYPRSSYYHQQRHMGTLMCHYQHRTHPDPLILPGIQDITTHVDFTAIADAALEVDMEVAGFTTQGYFLLNIGLLTALDPQQHQSKEYVMLANEVKKLTLPGEMGEHFKVLCLSKGLDTPIPGFDMHDMRHLL